jgi:hypothetical protein
MTRAADRSGARLAAVAFAYVLVAFVVCPENAVIGFPVHHDDFTFLSLRPWDHFSETARHVVLPRPVAVYARALFSTTGVSGYFLIPQLLVAAYVLLVLGTLERLLELEVTPLLMVVPVALAMLSQENLIEYGKDGGLTTDLLSATFGAGALRLIAGNAGAHASGPRKIARMAAIWVLAALSAWSKEDFIVPVCLMAVWLAMERPRSRDGWISTGGVLVVFAAWLVYDRLGENPYTHGARATYAANFSPASILNTTLTYIQTTRVTVLSAVAQASTLLLKPLAGPRVRWSRWLLFHVLIGVIILPYACLPEHTQPYYAFEWTVWQIGGALVLGLAAYRILAKRPSGLVTFAAAAAIAAVFVWTGQTYRRDVARWYQEKGNINRKIMALLSAHRAALAPYRLVAVDGTPFPGPWFYNDGLFFSRLYSLDHDWLVRVPVDSEYRKRLLELEDSPMIFGEVRTTTLDDAVPPGTPRVRLNPDGTGEVDLP